MLGIRSGRWWALGALVGAGATLAACNVVLGLDDLQERPTDASTAPDQGSDDAGDASSEPVKVVDVTTANCLALNATTIFYCEGNDIRSVPVGGGSSTVFATGAGPNRIALDATTVYWSEGTVVRTKPISGGNTQTLLTGVSPDFAVDFADVYYVAKLGDAGTPAVFARPVGGGPATGIGAVTDAKAMVSVLSVAYVAENDRISAHSRTGGASSLLEPASALATDGTEVYFLPTGTPKEVRRNDGLTSKVFGVPDRATGLAAHRSGANTWLFTVSSLDQNVYAVKLDKDGVSATVPLASGQVGLRQIATNDAYVVWTTANALMRAPLP